jgi:hypothetical protein
MIAVEKVCRRCPLKETCEIKEEFLEEVDFIISQLDGKQIDVLVAKEAVGAAIKTAVDKGCIGESGFYKGPGKILRFDQ